MDKKIAYSILFQREYLVIFDLADVYILQLEANVEAKIFVNYFSMTKDKLERRRNQLVYCRKKLQEFF